MNIDLSGKIAVVTGASGDLGRVMVRTLAECGADVAIHYHGNKTKAHDLADELRSKGRRALVIQADVTDWEAICHMRDTIARELGHPDVIVNNAVIQYKWKRVLDQDFADYESQWRSSVMHNLFMTKAFVPAMIDKGWGRVIGINTECSLQCWPTQSAYVSGKHGMNALLLTLAKEIGPHGITVNQVAPGWMFSDRDRDRERRGEGPADTSGNYTNMISLKHRGEDQDIANIVAFLASDLAKFITGAFIPVNGGGPTVPPWL